VGMFDSVETSKICKKCRQLFPLSNFHLDSWTKDGHASACKACRCLKTRLYLKTKNGLDKHRAYKRSDEWKAIVRERSKSTYRYHHCKGSAKFHGREWALTKDECLALWRMPCAYCGGKLPETGTGLDRMDDDRGYSADNVLPCCTFCNIARSFIFTVTEMREILGPAIAEVRKRRNGIPLERLKKRRVNGPI
jgi:hypothetical protein